MVFNKWRKVNRIQMKGVTHSPRPGQRSNRNGSKPGRIEKSEALHGLNRKIRNCPGSEIR